MLLSGTFLPLSTPPLSLLLFFSPRSFLPYTFFALTLERYSFFSTIVCLLGGISLRNSWARWHSTGIDDIGVTGRSCQDFAPKSQDVTFLCEPGVVKGGDPRTN
jgi:hypothetical protein